MASVRGARAKAIRNYDKLSRKERDNMGPGTKKYTTTGEALPPILASKKKSK